MKNISSFIVLSIMLSHCQGQQPAETEKKIYYDTLNLLMPKPGKEDLATAKDYRHCIDLTKEGYTVILNGKKYFQPDEHTLTSFIKAKRKDVTKTILSIISDSKTSYEKIVNALDVMTQQKIENFKFLSADGQLPSVPPIIIPTTTPPVKDIDLNDSTVFIISVVADTMKVSLLNKTNTFTRIDDVEKFILNNKGKIDPMKVVVTAPGNAKYAEIAPVLELLSKYGYHDRRLVPKD